MLLALISLAALLPSQDALAQDIAFSGAEIVNLAKTIVVVTAKTPQLPSAYQMTMTNGHTMVVTAPNAFELLCRAIIAWKETKAFPGEVAIELHDLKGPALDEKYEPRSAGSMIAVPTIDIGNYGPFWLKLAEAPGRTLPKAMTFETSYRLTPAQFIVAMSVLIDETLKKNEFPPAIAMPLVRSPQDWLSTERPVQVQSSVEPAQPAPAEIDLRISLNGIELTEAGPVVKGWRGPVPPFCGAIRIELFGHGPVGTVRLLLDNEELRSYQGIGPHRYELETLPLPDGLHTIAATATNTTGKTYAYVFSFTVQNGRRSGLSPAEIADLGIDLDIAPPKK